MKKDDRDKYKTYGKNRSLRLEGYDYSTPAAYFLTLCSFESKDFFSDEQLAEQIVTCLKECSIRCDYRLMAYCLMPDHLHLLVSPSEGARPVPQYVQAFKSLCTRAFWASYGEGKLWQRGFYDHIVRKEENLIEIAKYILYNPVRKWLSDAPEDYRFSGISDDFDLT